MISIADSHTNTEMFKGLSETEYHQILDHGTKKQLHSHEFLFHQDTPASQCYLVTLGQLKLTKLNSNGKEVTIRYIGVGEITAAVTVLRNTVYPVSAESIQATNVVMWDKPTMMALMRKFPEIAINLLGIVLPRIDDVQERYFEICTEQVDQRIARSLLRLMRWKGKKQKNGILIDLPLSRQSIANYSGTTLYTVSRTLSAWEKRGWILTARKKIIITDPHALISFTQ